MSRGLRVVASNPERDTAFCTFLTTIQLFARVRNVKRACFFVVKGTQFLILQLKFYNSNFNF